MKEDLCKHLWSLLALSVLIIFSIGSTDTDNVGVKQEELKQQILQEHVGWNVRTEISPINDSQNVYISLIANEPVKGWLKSYTPRLFIRCKENKTEAYIDIGMQAHFDRLGYGTQYHNVTIRFDKEKARQIEMGGSTDGEALFFAGPISMAKKMMGHNKMLFQFTPFNASPTTTTFDISGLEEAIKLLRKACQW